jgi:hypothetical protein
LSALSFQRRFSQLVFHPCELCAAWICCSSHRFDSVAGSHSLVVSLHRRFFSCADVCAPTSISALPRSGSVVFVGLVFAGTWLFYSFSPPPAWFSSSAPARFSLGELIGEVAKERTLDLLSALPRTRAGGFRISTSAFFGFSCLRFWFTVSIYPLSQCFVVW